MRHIITVESDGPLTYGQVLAVIPLAKPLGSRPGTEPFPEHEKFIAGVDRKAVVVSMKREE